mmetsp:Transcript_119622/g.333814  ORF Transcript_119622/g.333814 Transcript_119622/m.333814 type:complete len:204 (+) Transcript_119622:169-780(+)
MRSNFWDTSSSCFSSSSGDGFSRNLMVLTNACANSLPITCTASISKLESPSEMRFVMICESSWRCTSRKAWIFHLLTSPGKCGSYLWRAEITCTFCRTGSISGTHFAELYSTQPLIALVMMKVWPSRMASSISFRAAFSMSRRCRSTTGGSTCSCRRLRKDVHSKVSSQSNMMTVWCLGGRCAWGSQTCEYESFRRKFTRKSS